MRIIIYKDMVESKTVEVKEKEKAKEKKRSTWVSSKLYCRIRPAAHDGGGHDQSGAPVMKSLDAWDDTSVTLNT